MSHHHRQSPGNLSVPQRRHGGGGEKVGPWVLGRTLGRGTTGKVKAARHEATNQPAAVKIIKKAYVRTHKAKVAREIAVMRLIKHQYVMQLYDVYETQHHIFLVLERVKGGELFDYIVQKGRLPRKESLRIMSQITQGLEYCHMHSICHRDLKPENLLLDENLDIKIADFGMAQLTPDGRVLDTFCGSPHYGAPEVVSGTPYDGRRSDVWSLGVVFYAVNTGMLPFDNPNISTLLKMVKRGVYHMPKVVPEDIGDLIARMLVVDIPSRIKTEEIKFHRCFLGEHGTNLYFPTHPKPSPALEMMRRAPIRTEDDIDENIVKDLEGLGWGSSGKIKQRLLRNRDETLHNLEMVFYMLIAARNEKRRENGDDPASPAPPDEPESPAPVSFEPPSPSPTGGSGAPARSSSRSNTSTSAAASGGDASAASPSGGASAEPRSSGKRPKRKPLSIKVGTRADQASEPDAGRPEFSTTPRFHRMKLIGGSQEDMVQSPAAPITPTPKRSWFKKWFKRRPSLDVVSAQGQRSGASGMYSAKLPRELIEEIKSTMEEMGIVTKIASRNKTEFKCKCTCYLDKNFQVVILNPDGDIVYQGQDVERPPETASPNISPNLHQRIGSQTPRTPATPGTPSPSSPSPPSHRRSVTADVGAPQTIKFYVEVAREETDKVSTLNFKHREGNLLIYRGLHHDIVQRINL